VATVTIASFADFATLLAAGCGRAPDPAALDEMVRAAEDQARHFTHPGRARDDAIALFWQAAPFAFSDPAAFAAADPDLTADRMIAAIRASPLARDFTAAPLPEAFFRAVAGSMLRVMRTRATPSPPSSP
jgi:hypothetical protein